jgi:fermentation-respiration switch protein FrsA (DUF1100 family)
MALHHSPHRDIVRPADRVPIEDVMRRVLAFLTHLALLFAAWRCSHSTSGFLLNGPGLALLLDRYLLRLLPWSTPVRWSRELACGLCIGAINPVSSLRGVRVPIHFCHGCKDELVPVAEGKRLYESDVGPKRCWWVANATHYNVRQRNQQEYLSRLRSFFVDCLRESMGCG